ncbi:MAG: hypothetical protein AB7U20_02710 [Planctomycetaceae bacterium]
MPTWKCPLCGIAYESAGEQRPIVCAGCESLIYDTPSPVRRIPRRKADAPDAFRIDGADEDESQSRCERKELPNPPQAPMLAVAGVLTVVALCGLAASRFTPLGGGHTKASDVLIDATCGRDEPLNRLFRANGPWSLEWSMASSDPICLSSVQVWNGRGLRVCVAGSRTGQKNLDSVGEHRIVVHASRSDRVHVVARER